jgi:hypothetical protein
LYVGPSLRLGDLDGLDARIEVRPPIRRGDLPQAVAAGYDTFCIVDGEFYQTLAVSPKEILAALQTGCRIMGAASMGALRAAELAPYGMCGIGQIYRWFSTGEVSRDDDVAVSYAHDEGDFRLLTVPMVNVRWVVSHARTEGWLEASTCRRISTVARGIYWEDRSWRRLISQARLTPPETEVLLRYVHDPAHDLKRLDALAAIDGLQALVSGAPSANSTPPASGPYGPHGLDTTHQR